MWATPDDIRDRWAASKPLLADDEKIQKHIDDAEDAILTEFPNLYEDVPGKFPLARAVRVVSRMVIRFLRNSDGIRSQNSTTGPFSDQTVYGGDHPGEVYLTDEDRRDLSPRKNRRRAFTVFPGGVW